MAGQLDATVDIIHGVHYLAGRRKDNTPCQLDTIHLLALPLGPNPLAGMAALLTSCVTVFMEERH